MKLIRTAIVRGNARRENDKKVRMFIRASRRDKCVQILDADNFDKAII